MTARGQNQPAGRFALEQLQQGLDAVEESGVAVAGDLDRFGLDFQAIGLLSISCPAPDNTVPGRTRSRTTCESPTPGFNSRC